MTYLECALCGLTGSQIAPRLIEWAAPIGPKRFDLIPACIKVRDCYERVHDRGEDWPLAFTSTDDPLSKEGVAT